MLLAWRSGLLTPAVFHRYEAARKAAGFEAGQENEFLACLLTQWERSRMTKELTEGDVLAALDLDPEQEAALREVTDHTPFTLMKLLRIGLLAEISRSATSAATMAGRDMEDARQRRGVRGSAHALLQTVLAALMRANVEAVHWYEKVYITKTVLLNRTNVNRGSVNEFYEEHQEKIHAHHQAIGFVDEHMGVSHNRKAAVERRHAAAAVRQ